MVFYLILINQVMSLSHKFNHVKIMKEFNNYCLLLLPFSAAHHGKSVPADPAYRIGKLETDLPTTSV